MLFNSPIKSPIIIHKIISNLNFLIPALYTFAPIYIYTVFMRKKNLLLPVIDDVVKKVDIENGRVTVHIMEGLDDEV